ncbi:MAG: ComEC/Rec2 family competence protein [Deltaproteobacteria bacterium]|nr:ComEC/Rec2 family competence protein [Deltaproteobacteria bacterium]
MSDRIRPRLPGPVPALLPAVGLCLGVVSGPWCGAPTLLAVLGGLVVLVLAVLARGLLARPLGLVGGWWLLGVAMGGGPPPHPWPTEDGALLFEVELGAAPLDGRATLRKSTVLRAWPMHHGGRLAPSWQGPRDGLLRAPALQTLALGEGSRVLVAGRVGRDRGGRWVLRVRAGTPVVGGRTRPVSALRRAVRGYRAAVRRGVGAGTSDRTRALFLALALGDRTQIRPGLRAAFARTGTAHLLAISGLHVGMCWLWARSLARVLLSRLPARWTRGGFPVSASAAIGWGVAAGYVVLAGVPVSGLRALCMLGAVTAAQVSRRATSPWNTLAVAVIAVVALDPSAAGSLGFQLSVASVSFLLAWLPLPPELVGSWRVRAWRGLRLAVWTGLLGTLATAPLIAKTWGTVPLAGLWANAVAVPLLGAATVPPLLGGALLEAVHPGLGRALLRAADIPASVGIAVVRWLGDPRLAPELVWDPDWEVVVTFYLSLGAAMVWRRVR